MKSHVNPSVPLKRLFGFTLVEMLVATAMSSLLIGSIVALGMYASRSFNMIGNYTDLDAQSRNAADVLGREIRDASSLVAFSTNSPAYLQLKNNTTGQTIIIIYNSSSSKLVMFKTGGTTTTTWQTLLTDCNDWTFSLYNRHPDITADDIGFYPATNSLGQLDPSFCKVINMSWKCSRTIFGSPFNTESVQTAQIVLRNKMGN